MITLHEVTEGTKTSLKYGGILVATVLTMVLIFRIAGIIKGPPPIPGPEVCFGKLPNINFPTNSTDEKLRYKIETVSGKLQELPDRIKIYEAVIPIPDLQDLSRAQEKVSRIGFKNKGSALSTTLYRFEDQTDQYKKIDFDKVSLGFNFSTDFLSDKDVLDGTNRPDETGAVSLAQSFLSDIYSFPSIIDTEKTKTTLQTIENGKITSASNLNSSKLLRVDFYLKDIDKTPVFYPHPPFSNINVLTAGGKNGSQVVNANYFYQELGTKSCTYPVKTIEQAYKELQDGKAYIGFYNKTANDVPITTDAFLAYYMDEKLQNYVLPVIVFKGENDFYAYVRAIPDAWLTSSQ